MAYKITEDCTMCGTCASECSSQAISEGKDRYVIDNDIVQSVAHVLMCVQLKQ